MSFKYIRTQELVTRGLLENIRIPPHKNWFFWTVVLGRLLRVPWTAKRSNQSILKEISLEYSLEGLMLKLKLQYFGHVMRRTGYLKRPWCWERLKVGGEEDDRGWDSWMASMMQWTWVWINSGSWWWTGNPGMLQSVGLQRVGHDWATELNYTWRVKLQQKVWWYEFNIFHCTSHTKLKMKMRIEKSVIC